MRRKRGRSGNVVRGAEDRSGSAVGLRPVASHRFGHPDGRRRHAVVASTPYTFEEAETWIELNFPANGYSQMSKIGRDGQVVFMFQNESKMVTVTIMDDGDGMAVVQFAAVAVVINRRWSRINADD